MSNEFSLTITMYLGTLICEDLKKLQSGFYVNVNIINMQSRFKIFNGTEVWQIETSLPSIPTFSQDLDKMLGNDGVQLGAITEILGLPGAGKTQICLQICASVQIPKMLGGLNAEALYIDTNTDFTLQRFEEILSASLSKCEQLTNNRWSCTLQDALNKLHFVDAFGLDKFCAFLNLLPQFIAAHPNIKLIVIDSIAFPFKQGIDVKKRTGLLYRQMADLQRLAIQQRIAIVLTNEMSTRVGLSGGTGGVVGALGDAWSHRCNKRVLVSRDPARAGHASAVLLKSNDTATATAQFQITQDGIRDVDIN